MLVEPRIISLLYIYIYTERKLTKYMAYKQNGNCPLLRNLMYLQTYLTCFTCKHDKLEIKGTGMPREDEAEIFFLPPRDLAVIPFRHSLLSERKCINFHRWTLTYAREIHSQLWRGAFWLWLMAPHLPSARVSCTPAMRFYTRTHFFR